MLAAAMAGNKRNTATYLPHEIIENILSRLPVKSLLRFESVSKPWNATISDPKFAQTHLQISKISSSLSLSCLLVNQEFSPQTAQLVSFENDEFTLLSAVDYPTPFNNVLCHCDGLYVISSSDGSGNEYALWNPSRRSYKRLNQYTFDPDELICGICYDPLVNDYKVLMADAKYYAVFYCGKNHWSDLREMNPNLKIRDCHGSGAPLKGSVYWVYRGENGYQIVCFDGRDEKFKNLGKVGIDGRAGNIKLISSREGLYVFHSDITTLEFLLMKKVGDGDEWVKLKEYGGGLLEPTLCSHGNKILLRYPYGDYVVIYDVSKGSFTGVECPWNSLFGFGRRLFPYQENIFCTL